MRVWLAVAALCNVVQAETYLIRPVPGSRFSLEVSKTGFLSGKKHLFEFERYEGKLDYRPEAPEQSRVELTIEAASIALKDDWLSEKDFKKVKEHAEKEMLDVVRHPRLRFVSSRITRKPNGGFEAQGELTIRAATRPVTVEVQLRPEAGKLRLKGKAEVPMKDFGLKPPSALLGTIGTKNEMRVEFDLTAAR
jgi:polyisoprenoid-binding protein YceI